MRNRFAILLVLLTSTIALKAQVAYSTSYSTTTSTSTSVVTVQQLPTSTRIVRFNGLYFKTSAACNFTLENNGTPATTTTLAVSPVNSDSRAASVLAFSSSNVGSGTVLGTYTLAAGEWRTLDLTGFRFSPLTQSNLTLRSSSCSAVIDISFRFTESDT